MNQYHLPSRLAEAAPQLERVLLRYSDVPPAFAVPEIRCETIQVTMRDGIRLSTDFYFPPKLPAPTIAIRTPYGRAKESMVGSCFSFARRGYVVASQDCRGTGESEPESWDYYIYEPEDSYDFLEWITQQDWFDGFLGSCGGSYLGQTQWCMSTHPKMSTIVPEVSGLGIAVNTAHLHMFVNAYARSVGKGEDKIPLHYSDLERLMLEETLAGGYFNDPLHPPLPETLLAQYPFLRTMPPPQAKHWLWEQYCSLTCSGRAAFVKKAMGTNVVTIAEVESLGALFGHKISHDAHTLPNTSHAKMCSSLNAPTLMITGWYDWGLNDALATWDLLQREARSLVRSRSRLIIAPDAHNRPGYHEGVADHPELLCTHRVNNNTSLLLHWYAAVREGTTDAWPMVVYYLMGANEWQVSASWPSPETQQFALYLGSNGALTAQSPQQSSEPDQYVYNPDDPTPTLGGSIVSYVYPPGSVDVSQVQRRPDVLTYTTTPLEGDIDVVGPLHLILYASSSAIDTDFSARLSDVFPDGRAIQLQSGILRTRYRSPDSEPELLEPGRIYRFEIDMWATANRFKARHRIRLDICSADFPRFDRNTNRGGLDGPPEIATQTIYHDAHHPSHLVLSVLNAGVAHQTTRN